ncbi:MAG TPA: cellulase family glycosylhydrolase, partial [Verrucomicrobiae bacterium]
MKINVVPFRNLPTQFGGILFLLTICLGCVSQRPAISSATNSDSFRHVTIGLCEDYPEESRTLTAARRDLEVLATNDLRVLRIAFGWDAMEPEPGKFDWSFWDDFVRLAVDEYHIRLIPYICYTPRWASSSDGEDFWRQPPKDNAAFANFVKQLVAHYRDRIHSWEIWNEPDNPSYWGGTVDQFADLLATGANAIHATDPTANIVMGGLAWDLNFLEGVLAHPEAMTHVDVINLHNYYETWSSDPLERIPEYVGRTHDILR